MAGDGRALDPRATEEILLGGNPDQGHPSSDATLRRNASPQQESREKAWLRELWLHIAWFSFLAAAGLEAVRLQRLSCEVITGFFQHNRQKVFQRAKFFRNFGRFAVQLRFRTGKKSKFIQTAPRT